MKKVSLLLPILFFSILVDAQNVGINTPSPTSALDINGGLRLRPEVTSVIGTSVMLTSNRAHHILSGSPTGDFTIAFIGATESGQHLIITNSTLFNGFMVPVTIRSGVTAEFIYSSGSWKLIGSNEATTNTAWGLKGNAGTDTSVNFIGTTDNKPLVFKINNERAGLIDKGANTALGHLSLPVATIDAAENTAVGAMALRFLKDGTKNTAIGAEAAGNLKSGSLNVAVGQFALLSDTAGSETVAVGPYALAYNQNRVGNTALGAYALVSNGLTYSAVILPTQGLQNTAIGHSSLYSNQRGSGAVAIGFQAAYSDTAADGIVAIGRAALYKNNGGSNNLAIGDSALFNNSSAFDEYGREYFGAGNVALGRKALFSNTSGGSNVALGYNALINNEKGSANIAIGTRAMSSMSLGYQNIGIGQQALEALTEGGGNIAMGTASFLLKKGRNNIILGNILTIPALPGFIDSAVENVIIGNRESLRLKGHRNIYMGNNSGSGIIYGSENVGIGDGALGANTFNQFGYSNVAIGTKALARNTTASNLVAVGDSALFNLNGGVGNTAVGSKSAQLNTTGNYNTSLGSSSLSLHVTGDDNTVIGATAFSSGVSGNGNTVVGRAALQSSSGSNNVAMGINAMLLHQTGITNVAIGPSALLNNINGTGNIAIGASAGSNETTSNKLYIENTGANKDNALIYGDFAADSLLLNAKTVVRNNAVVRGFTKLGGYGTDVPSIKMKELTGMTAITNNGSRPISLGGVDPQKIISVSTLVGVASNAVWLPTGYDNDPRLKYNYFVHNDGNIYIQNQSTDCTLPGDHICNKTVKIVVTYKE